MSAKRRPCRSCPWRKDAGGATAIPNFNIELAEKLSATCPDSRGMGPDWGAPVFACHQSREGEEIVCAGWLAQVGYCHPLARIKVMRGEWEADALSVDEDWPELYESWPEALATLRED